MSWVSAMIALGEKTLRMKQMARQLLITKLKDDDSPATLEIYEHGVVLARLIAKQMEENEHLEYIDAFAIVCEEHPEAVAIYLIVLQNEDHRGEQ